MLNEKKAGPVLVKGLKSNSNWIKWEALSAIKSLKYKPAINSVCALCLDKKSTELKREGALTLGAIGTPKAMKTLKILMDDPDPQVRWRAVMAFTKNARSIDISFLQRNLKKEKEKVVKEQLKTGINLLKNRS